MMISWRSESIRWLVLLTASLFLCWPYFSPKLIGTGDALWYHNLLADAVLQFRSGVFPVYVGQSEFMFNGAVYPHRVAPYHQYLGGLLDLISGRRFSFFALQHLTIILSFIGGTFGAYFSLTRLAPKERWRATLLSILYLACPGVIGLAYAQDLYMSVMTLPWVPLALGGAWLTFHENSPRSLAMIVIGLGMLWWAHPPIAMWVTLVIGLQQTIRLVHANDRMPLLKLGLPAVCFLALLLAYPVTSAFSLRESGETVVPYVMDRALLLKEVSNSYPANLLPLNPTASPLSQLQLGYSLWLILVGLLVSCVCVPSLAALLASSLALFLLALVLPVPGITRVLWLSFPEQLVGLSLYWPMQRLYIIISGLVVLGAQSCLSGKARLPGVNRLISITLIFCIIWSLVEATTFIRTASRQAAINADSGLWAYAENATPMRHAYHLFSRQPATMSHGVMDPESESRLLNPQNLLPLPTQNPAPIAERIFSASRDVNPGILNLMPGLTLEPGHHYHLTFDFADHDYAGILQIIGHNFFREYALPASGNPRAFGTGPKASHMLPLWTTSAAPTVVHLRFIPSESALPEAPPPPFARFHFQAVDEINRHITLKSLIPYLAVVKSPQPALLETPRMYVPGYSATVDNAPVVVQKSPEGFVTVEVPPGESTVAVQFIGSSMLRITFYTSCIAWCLAALFVFRLTLHPILTAKWRPL